MVLKMRVQVPSPQHGVCCPRKNKRNVIILTAKNGAYRADLIRLTFVIGVVNVGSSPTVPTKFLSYLFNHVI